MGLGTMGNTCSLAPYRSSRPDAWQIVLREPNSTAKDKQHAVRRQLGWEFNLKAWHGTIQEAESANARVGLARVGHRDAAAELEALFGISARDDDPKRAPDAIASDGGQSGRVGRWRGGRHATAIPRRVLLLSPLSWADMD